MSDHDHVSLTTAHTTIPALKKGHLGLKDCQHVTNASPSPLIETGVEHCVQTATKTVEARTIMVNISAARFEYKTHRTGLIQSRSQHVYKVQGHEHQSAAVNQPRQSLVSSYGVVWSQMNTVGNGKWLPLCLLNGKISMVTLLTDGNLCE